MHYSLLQNVKKMQVFQTCFKPILTCSIFLICLEVPGINTLSILRPATNEIVNSRMHLTKPFVQPDSQR